MKSEQARGCDLYNETALISRKVIDVKERCAWVCFDTLYITVYSCVHTNREYINTMIKSKSYS